MAEMAKTAAMYNVTIIINPDKLVPLKAALNAVGVALVDHVIVADGDFVSLADDGLL